jgi:hypothetical protein
VGGYLKIRGLERVFLRRSAENNEKKLPQMFYRIRLRKHNKNERAAREQKQTGAVQLTNSPLDVLNWS